MHSRWRDDLEWIYALACASSSEKASIHRRRNSDTAGHYYILRVGGMPLAEYLPDGCFLEAWIEMPVSNPLLLSLMTHPPI